MAARNVALGTVLSATTGYLLCDFTELQDFLEFMAGEPVWTHQLGRVAAEVRTSLAISHPDVADLTFPGVPDGVAPVPFIMRWLDDLTARIGYGAVELSPLHGDDHTPIDPIDEFRMHSDAEIIVIETD
jgi:hypothetical protein